MPDLFLLLSSRLPCDRPASRTSDLCARSTRSASDTCDLLATPQPILPCWFLPVTPRRQLRRPQHKTVGCGVCSPCFWKLLCPEARGPQPEFTVRVRVSLAAGCLPAASLLVGRRAAASGRALISPSAGGGGAALTTSSKHNYPPKAPPLNTVTLGLRRPHTETRAFGPSHITHKWSR